MLRNSPPDRYFQLPDGPAERRGQRADRSVRHHGLPEFLSEQAQLSIQRQVETNTSVTVSGIWSRGLHIASAYNANLSAPTQSYTYLIDDASGNQVGTFTSPLYTRANLINPNYNSVMVMSSNANSWYDGLIVSVNHRYASWFEGSANYTWSHTIDDNLGGAGGPPGSSGILFAAELPHIFLQQQLRG